MHKKSYLFLICLILALALTVCKSNSRENTPSINERDRISDLVRDNELEPISGKTAFDYFRDERIFSGWNLGNSLDSYSDGLGSETGWGNASINQEIMNGVKAAGFDIIRIPVTWMGYIGNAPGHRVASFRLKRVADVIEMAHNADLKVIINIHHDGSTPSPGRDDGWLSISKAYKNARENERITLQFARLWDQIAAYLQNYGDWLMFESMNEIHDGGWAYSTDFKMFPSQQLDVLNRWNQTFLDSVRSTGGNNPNRYLVIPAYCTNPQQTLSSSFVLPNDRVPGKLIVTFHYYDPHEFGIEGRRTAWGTPAEKQKVDSDFAPFKARFIDNNIPVIIGECGAVLQLYPADATRQAQARQSRFDYIPHVFATAKKYGLVPIYWDNGSIRGNGEKFGLFDRRTGQPNSEDSATLITMMINAVR